MADFLWRSRSESLFVIHSTAYGICVCLLVCILALSSAFLRCILFSTHSSRGPHPEVCVSLFLLCVSWTWLWPLIPFSIAICLNITILADSFAHGQQHYVGWDIELTVWTNLRPKWKQITDSASRSSLMPNISRWQFLYITNVCVSFFPYRVSFVRDMPCVANVYILVSSCPGRVFLFCLILVFLGCWESILEFISNTSMLN